MKGRPLVQDKTIHASKRMVTTTGCSVDSQPTLSLRNQTRGLGPGICMFVQSSSRILMLSEGCMAPSAAFRVSGSPVPPRAHLAGFCFLASLIYSKLTIVPPSCPSNSGVVQPQCGRHLQEEKLQFSI